MRRNDSFEQMDRLFENMRRLMWDMRPASGSADVAGGTGTAFDRRSGLSSSLQEQDGEYSLVVDLPGFERDELDIRYDDGMLSLSGRHEDDTGTREFDESVWIPQPVVADEITAKYRNGVLTVTMPVDESRDSGRRIPVTD